MNMERAKSVVDRIGNTALVTAPVICVHMNYTTYAGFITIARYKICVYFLPQFSMCLSLSLLVHLIGLTGKPATGNVIVQVFLPVFASTMINLGVHNVLDVTSWSFALVIVGLAVLIGVITALMRPRLTAERIVLS